MDTFRQILTQLNWIDILVIVTIITASYKGSQAGFSAEIFKLIGLILSIYLSLHYFSQASDLLTQYAPVIGMIFADFFCFLTIAVLAYLSMAILRGVFTKFVKAEATAVLDRWGGLFLGAAKGFLFISLLFLLFHLSSAPYLRNSLKKSRVGNSLTAIDVKVYEFIFNGLVSKFSPNEQLNQSIKEVLEEE